MTDIPASVVAEIRGLGSGEVARVYSCETSVCVNKTLIGSYTAGSMPGLEELFSPTGFMLVEFTSTALDKYTNFQLSYELASLLSPGQPDTANPPCEVLEILPNTLSGSLVHRGPYADGESRCWVIAPMNGSDPAASISFWFTELDTEEFYDTVSFRICTHAACDGPGGSVPTDWVFSGSSVPLPITLRESAIMVFFSADALVHGTGFSLAWTANASDWRQPVLCGSPSPLSSPTGSILFEPVGGYVGPLTCVWTLEVPGADQLQVWVENERLGENDALEIRYYDIASAVVLSAPLAAHAAAPGGSGSMSGPVAVRVESNKVEIKLQAGALQHIPDSGFALHYSSSVGQDRCVGFAAMMDTAEGTANVSVPAGPRRCVVELGSTAHRAGVFNVELASSSAGSVNAWLCNADAAVSRSACASAVFLGGIPALVAGQQVFSVTVSGSTPRCRMPTRARKGAQL